jgi:hypothetical protein
MRATPLWFASSDLPKIANASTVDVTAGRFLRAYNWTFFQ